MKRISIHTSQLVKYPTIQSSDCIGGGSGIMNHESYLQNK